MKLLETGYNEYFSQTIHEWAVEFGSNSRSVLFHVYVPFNKPQELENLKFVRKVLKEEFPDAQVVGCSATGMILNGKVQNDAITVSAMIFEDDTTTVIVRTSYDKQGSMDPQKLLEFVISFPDLKGIEVLTAAPYQPLLDTSSVIDTIPENIEIFGAVAVGDDTNPSFVFADDQELGYGRTALVFYAGKNLHLLTNRMFGWSPIGYPLEVTKSEGTVVHELDNKPAYDVYHHYLHIKKDNNFFYDALDFPWEVKADENTYYIRHAKSVNSDGSIVMSSNIPQGSKIRLTYGDPRRIMKHTKQTISEIFDFEPEVVNIFNCFGRMLFWSGRENIEIQEISDYQQTTGFSALGEIMRHKGNSVLNNLSIVTIAMREGEHGHHVSLSPTDIEDKINIPVTARLAIFINTITEELMQKNDQLNEMLYKASHDALTGILNRGAIERAIYEKCDQCEEFKLSGHLIMFDVDDFKQINDTFGHAIGDKILISISTIVGDYLNTIPGAVFGRWGGEEFMIFIYGQSDDLAKDIADNILNKVKNEVLHEREVTVSIGVTKHYPLESVMQTLTRADELLYSSKSNGKAQVTCDF
ncbi:sensor domain-containing diguanylate cyclase [Butyrivibrio sp. FCS006]|uniref:sensor domain-containing diguanylate cyclase n=1 Tax=Butyrivibrio sp. FCS006 TaxID=1280684 RepID=UPI000429B3BE|nr:diguanylate cyclase [Butyrivibrio sp. FCS006]